MRDLFFEDCFIEGFEKLNKKYKVKYDYWKTKNALTLTFVRKLNNDLNAYFRVSPNGLSCFFYIHNISSNKNVFMSKTTHFKTVYKIKPNFKNYVYNGLLYIHDFLEKFKVLYEN